MTSQHIETRCTVTFKNGGFRPLLSDTPMSDLAAIEAQVMKMVRGREIRNMVINQTYDNGTCENIAIIWNGHRALAAEGLSQ